MQNLMCFLVVVFAAALSADGSMPEGMRNFFFPGGIGNNEDVQDTQQGKDEDRLSLLQSTIEEARRSYDEGDFSRFMVAKPVQKAQCYVEVQVTQRQPGRCIRLGGLTPACQTNDYLSINFNECS